MRAWVHDYGAEADAKNIDGPYAARVAERCAELWCRNNAEFPDSLRVHVRADDGELMRFDVELRQVIEYRATMVAR